MKKLLLLLTVSITGSLLLAAPDTPAAPRREFRKQRSENRKGQHHIWRAFAELNDAERKEMMKLQRNDPEKFRKVMQKKVEDIVKAEKIERQKLLDLAKLYRNAKTDKEKTAVKQQISEILKRRFIKRLAANRRHLEGMKRRTAKLEKELDKKEANTDKIVALQTDAILSGKRLLPPRGPRRGPGISPAAGPARQK